MIRTQTRVYNEEAQTVTDFAQAIIDATCHPRSKRANLDTVNVTGSAHDLATSQDTKYRFIATFFKSGDKFKYQNLVYKIVGDYDGTFNETEVVTNNLALIQERIRILNENIKSGIEGKVLVVDSTFKEFEPRYMLQK